MSICLRVEISEDVFIVTTRSSATVGFIASFIGRSVISSSSSLSHSYAKGSRLSLWGRVADALPTCYNKHKAYLECTFNNIRKDKRKKYQDEKHTFSFLGADVEPATACVLFKRLRSKSITERSHTVNVNSRYSSKRLIKGSAIRCIIICISDKQ